MNRIDGMKSVVKFDRISISIDVSFVRMISHFPLFLPTLQDIVANITRFKMQLKHWTFLVYICYRFDLRKGTSLLISNKAIIEYTYDSYNKGIAWWSLDLLECRLYTTHIEMALRLTLGTLQIQLEH
jgi:hypothetical protein